MLVHQIREYKHHVYRSCSNVVYTRMSKTILIAVSDGFGGYGDFLFALKLAAQLQKHYFAESENNNAPSVYIVTQPSGKQKIQTLKGDDEFRIGVLTPAELKMLVEKQEIEIGTLLEGPVFKSELIDAIDDALATAPDPIPLTMLPEYGYLNGSDHTAILELHRNYRQQMLKHITYSNMVLSGFNAGEHGILLSDELITPKPKNESIAQLDDKIKQALKNKALGDDHTIPEYLQQTDLYFQYSHDSYSTHYENLTGNHAVYHFLNLHQAFVQHQEKNQAVIMVGKRKDHKLNALLALYDNLIADGFEKITFLNADTQEEMVLYNSGKSGKIYQGIYTSNMSHSSMIACTALSGVLMGATGDQSFGEAVSRNKVIVYECLKHKENFIASFNQALMNIVPNVEIDAILDLLRTASTNAEYQNLAQALHKHHTLLMALYETLFDRYNYINAVVDGIELDIDFNQKLQVMDPAILRTANGFYKMSVAPIGTGGWSSVHQATHYSVDNKGLSANTEMVIKKMPSHQHDVLQKEGMMLQKACAITTTEHFTFDHYTYLAMPRINGNVLSSYLLHHANILKIQRLEMAIYLFNALKKIHANGIVHLDIKPKNILINPITNKLRLIDFGCAETIGTSIQYTGLATAKYAIEHMPPEYLENNPVTVASDIYSMCLTLAAILGLDVVELVENRMERALESIQDPFFKEKIRDAFWQYKSLDEALFSDQLTMEFRHPEWELFIQSYVQEEYDFSLWEGRVSTQIIGLLYAMQSKNPQERPDIDQCLYRLQYPQLEPISTAALLRLLQEGKLAILLTEEQKRPWLFKKAKYLALLYQQIWDPVIRKELKIRLDACSAFEKKQYKEQYESIFSQSSFFSTASTSPESCDEEPMGSLSAGQLIDLNRVKCSLTRKINSMWPHRHKELKQQEIQALDTLVELAKTTSLKNAIAQIMQLHPHLKTKDASTVTMNFLNALQSEITLEPGAFI